VTRFGPPEATCTVRAFKAGLLSAVGHDVELRVTRFSIELGDDGVVGTFDGTSLEVAGAIRDGRVEPSAFSEKDRRDILENVRKYTFPKHQPARIRFESTELVRTDEGLEGEGELTIPPHTRPIRFEVVARGGRAVCEVRLNQPDFGITPYKAALGGLRIQPDLLVRVEVPWSE
jgi:hypothetical protein